MLVQREKRIDMYKHQKAIRTVAVIWPVLHGSINTVAL